MPELPDITLYADALRPRALNQPLRALTIKSLFLLRSADPAPDECLGRPVVEVSRLGKRIVLSLDGDLHLVLHLMIAGRLHWKPSGTRPKSRIDLAVFDFPSGALLLTEAGTRKRASLHICRGRDDLLAHDPGGIDPLTADLAAFAAALTRENRTLKRALASPRLFSGIGNAYSDEILHAARLSPLKLTSHLTPDETARLHLATRDTLTEWIARLRAQFGYDPATGAPTPDARFAGVGDITAFRPDFAAHGRYGLPCPACATPIQRIVYAENETNYCPTCQTDGKLLADRALSRLLKDDWPRTIEDWERG